MVRSARTFIEQRQFDDALAAIQTAIEYDPDLAEARLLQVAVLAKKGQRDEALKQCQAYAERLPNDAEGRRLLSICEKACLPKSIAIADRELAAILQEHGLYTLAADFVSVDKDRQALYRARIEKAWPGAGTQLSWDDEVDGLSLDLNFRKDVSDLTPLTGMPLRKLTLFSTAVRDLAPLKGMALKRLAIDGTQVTDLSPLKGMPVTFLGCNNTRIADLTPLKGMQLTTLTCGKTLVSDLAPLKGMPLTLFYCDDSPVSDLAPLKGMPLTSLSVGSTKVADLTPLKGMKLTYLHIGWTTVWDLTPLKGMPLTKLNCAVTPVSDLTPLHGMPLTSLYLSPGRITIGWEVIRKMTSLRFLDGNGTTSWTHDEFFKKLDAGEFK